LVVFDTWTANCDRCPAEGQGRRPNHDNVFFSQERGEEPILLAIDHSHCFTCGNDLTTRVASIDRVQDSRVYGLFPAFVNMVRRDRVQESVARLVTLPDQLVRDTVDSIPGEWQVGADVRAALGELIIRRAGFVAEHIEDALQPRCWRM
jgi:hypothetical protein